MLLIRIDTDLGSSIYEIIDKTGIVVRFTIRRLVYAYLGTRELIGKIVSKNGNTTIFKLIKVKNPYRIKSPLPRRGEDAV